MRWAAPALALLALGGCLEGFPGLGQDEPVVLVDSALAIDEMQDWLANATTRDALVGSHWREGTGGDEVALPSERSPVWTVAPPYLTRLDAVEGPANWSALFDLLANSDDSVHPDYWDLLFESIHGTYFPEDYEGPINGVAARWVGQWQVQWDHDTEARWDLERRGDVSLSSLRSGAGRGSCPDLVDDSVLVNSTAALALAQNEAPFQKVQQEQPEGEAWLTLFVQDPPAANPERRHTILECPDSASPRWRVRWMDIDAMIGSGAGPYVDVVLNASSGEVERVYGAIMRPPRSYVWTNVLNALEPTVGTPMTSTWTFEVPPGQVRLRVDVQPATPAAGASVGSSGSYVLRDPDGQDMALDEFIWWYADVTHPIPGVWQLERVLEPGVDASHPVRQVTARVVG